MKTKFCADEVMVNLPLFHSGDGGSIPTSALQFHFEPIHRDTFMPLNEAWHSRLPDCKNAFAGFFFGAVFEHKYYAVAWWSHPVARALNGKGWVELRRFAISSEAPKNTASRMLGWMVRTIRKTGEYEKAISYQDEDVHSGTIYKASGWTREKIGQRIDESKGWNNWKTREGNRKNQSTAPKHRWAINLKANATVEARRERASDSSED